MISYVSKPTENGAVGWIARKQNGEKRDLVTEINFQDVSK
jgi:hypothetical protein